MNKKDTLMDAISGSGNLRDAVKVLIEAGKQTIGAPSVSFRAESLALALMRFLKSEVNATDLEQWCEALEGNDAIEYEEGHQQVISSILFEVSSPDINGPLTLEKCIEMLAKLKEASR